MIFFEKNAIFDQKLQFFEKFSNFQVEAEKLIGCEPESRMLPTPREFCRHILSERTTQAASNKRRLHPVSGGITL